MERSTRSEDRATRRRLRAVAAALLLAMAVAGLPVPAAAEERGAGAGEAGAVEGEAAGGPGGERIEIRRSRPPRAEERERAGRWHRRWSREAAPLARVLGGLEATGPGGDPEAPVADPEWCRTLASALVRFDRERALPAPLYAADRPLRRGLDELTAAAFACLEGRYHASAHHVASGLDDFAEAAEVLRRYGVDL